ncbi:FAD-dependent oxidoreductase [Marivirga salinae]|uniref:NADH:ubiquinone reductase (non-electrogenic) n=1 Tax=Marivirga salinarum TaxID=3059078 RepID=A0AA51RE67_9BACT|nr:FAD-dependent oxidoreductase [Marivirga sp. BDSF4-3]WMN11085.1 FAD-dependent oxidoreductase [Marivirga sp. BDSF4-3]
MEKKKVIFIGCGYVSVWAYKELYGRLRKKINNKEIEVTVISISNCHDFHGFTGEFINGFLPINFKSTPQEQIFKGANYIQAKLKSIQASENAVEYINDNGDVAKLHYDQLVLGTGSLDNFDSIEGANAYGLSVKKSNGIKELRERLVRNLTEAENSNDPNEIESLLSFTVIGAGFAGVEVSGNLVESLNILKSDFPILEKYSFKVNLVYSSDEILPQLQKKRVLRNYSIKTIEKLGIHLYPNQKVQKIVDGKVFMEDGSSLNTNFVVCTMGQTNDVYSKESSMKINDSKRLIVDAFLKNPEHGNIWSGGDAAIVKRPYFSGTCNYDALWAIKHGTRIGKNLTRVLKNKKPGKFKYPGLGQTASFYKNKAILEIYGLPFTGILAWYIRIGFFLYFMPSRRLAFNAFKSILFDSKIRKSSWHSLIQQNQEELIIDRDFNKVEAL